MVIDGLNDSGGRAPEVSAAAQWSLLFGCARQICGAWILDLCPVRGRRSWICAPCQAQILDLCILRGSDRRSVRPAGLRSWICVPCRALVLALCPLRAARLRSVPFAGPRSWICVLCGTQILDLCPLQSADLGSVPLEAAHTLDVAMPVASQT